MTLSNEEIKRLQEISAKHKQIGGSKPVTPSIDKEDVWDYVPHGLRFINNCRDHVRLHVPDATDPHDNVCYLTSDENSQTKLVTEDIKPIRYEWCKRCLKILESENNL